MKIHYMIIAALLAVSAGGYSQNAREKILIGIEKNNTTLAALRKSTEAEKISNKTGLYLQNPEVAFNYLWGSPVTVGSRTDISVLQTFDFPTAYGVRKDMAGQRDIQAELEYLRQYRIILTKARQYVTELTYLNARKSESEKRVSHAREIADAYKTRFDAGDANILEMNKAQINLLNRTKEFESIEIGRKFVLAELTGLNGGIPVDFQELQYAGSPLAPDFDQWYGQMEATNPLLGWLRQEVAISQNRVKLNKAMALPKMQAGYMSEKVVGLKYQGVTLGMTIPLWENKNQVKFAKAKVLAVQEMETDVKVILYNQLKGLYAKADGLRNNLADYRLQLERFSSTSLLRKALEKGEISLAEYIFELSQFYEGIDNLLALERDLNVTLVELYQYQ